MTVAIDSTHYRSPSSLSSLSESLCVSNRLGICTAELVSSAENVHATAQTGVEVDAKTSVLHPDANNSRQHLHPDANNIREHLLCIPASQIRSPAYGRRFFSLDDIDQLKIEDTSESRHVFPSNSSSTLVTLRNSHIDFPVDAPFPPPPPRRPTPPGIPSFGSPEAMRMRGIPRRHSLRFPLSDTSYYQPDPRTLPRGVIGIAPDGTAVRSRFGARQSGHGVGAGGGLSGWRGVEGHPFHQVADRSEGKSRPGGRSNGDSQSIGLGDIHPADRTRVPESRQNGASDGQGNEKPRTNWWTWLWIHCCADDDEYYGDYGITPRAGQYRGYAPRLY